MKVLLLVAAGLVYGVMRMTGLSLTDASKATLLLIMLLSVLFNHCTPEDDDNEMGDSACDDVHHDRLQHQQPSPQKPANPGKQDRLK